MNIINIAYKFEYRHEKEYSAHKIMMVSSTLRLLSFIGQSSGVNLAFKEQGIVLDVGDVVKDRDESKCGTA